MNRFLPIFLLCLLLTGCGAKAPVASAQTPVLAEPAPTVPSGHYEPGSPSEAITHGALKTYPLDSSQVTGIFPLGNRLLLLSGEETTLLTVLEASSLTALNSMELPFHLDPGDPSLALGSDRISCYDPVHKVTLVLSETLAEVQRIPAPAGLQGVPILSFEDNTLYYCTAQGVWGWDQSSGLHRKIAEMTFSGQQLAGVSQSGTVLTCRIPEEENVRTLLLSSRTGEILYEQTGIVTLSGKKDSCLADLPAGLSRSLIWWNAKRAPQLFLPGDPSARCYFLEDQAAAVTVAATSGGYALDAYDLPSGTRRASLAWETCTTLTGLTGTADGSVFLLGFDPDYGCHALYRWDFPSDFSDNQVYCFPWDADPEKRNACESYAQELEERFGIEILLGQEAIQTQPWNYDLEPERHPAVIQRELELLDQRLSQLPDPILKDTAGHFTSLKLCIVRSIRGTAESGDTSLTPQLQFHQDRNAYVVITSGAYSGESLYHGLFLCMETHLLTDSLALDRWDKQNPPDFSYGTHSPDSLYLQEEDRAFLDLRAMAFPREDRAGILTAAMLPGNQSLFHPWRMQRKLTTLCKGIREAYDLEDDPRVFPWEQYLFTPLAPQ